ncbi:MAG TPA: hypothetical protein VFS50_18175 [Meiothermus sp.]|jgi:opacity protein-like surface antigen|nr:hypothetical protein [Meiothermus sp.]
MKKLLFTGLTALALAAPASAQSFSLTGQVQATYSQEVVPNLRVGVLGRLGAGVVPSPFSVGVLLRPFATYTVDVVENGPLSVSAFAGLRLPLTISLLPSPVEVGFDIVPRVGVDLTYKLSEMLDLLSGLEFAVDIPLAPSGRSVGYGLSGYVEADYYMNPLTIYGGLSLDQIVPTPFAWSLYLGADYALASNLTFKGELGYGGGFYGLLRLAFTL